MDRIVIIDICGYLGYETVNAVLSVSCGYCRACENEAGVLTREDVRDLEVCECVDIVVYTNPYRLYCIRYFRGVETKLTHVVASPAPKLTL